MSTVAMQERTVLSAQAKECLTAAVIQNKSQAAVARMLGVSPAVVSTLLKDKYAGDVAQMEQRIRGHFLGEMVVCPVVGELGRQHCIEFQKRPKSYTNPQRSALSSACPQCPNNCNKESNDE